MIVKPHSFGGGKTMKDSRSVGILLVVLSAFLAGCISGKAMTLPGSLSRPVSSAPAPEGSQAVAVLDFDWQGEVPAEVGRDYDHVRPIVYKGSPGRAMADLVAAAMRENGIAAVRVASEGGVPGGVSARVWGRVETFRVDVRRIDSVKADGRASVGVTVMGAQAGSSQTWSSAVSSSLQNTTPLFLPPESVLQLLSSAANAVADEAVRRLAEAGIVAPSPEPEPPPTSSSPPGVVETK
jgi:hypothetical protein